MVVKTLACFLGEADTFEGGSVEVTDTDSSIIMANVMTSTRVGEDCTKMCHDVTEWKVRQGR